MASKSELGKHLMGRPVRNPAERVFQQESIFDEEAEPLVREVHLMAGGLCYDCATEKVGPMPGGDDKS